MPGEFNVELERETERLRETPRTVTRELTPLEARQLDTVRGGPLREYPPFQTITRQLTIHEAHSLDSARRNIEEFENDIRVEQNAQMREIEAEHNRTARVELLNRNILERERVIRSIRQELEEYEGRRDNETNRNLIDTSLRTMRDLEARNREERNMIDAINPREVNTRRVNRESERLASRASGRLDAIRMRVSELIQNELLPYEGMQIDDHIRSEVELRMRNLFIRLANSREEADVLREELRIRGISIGQNIRATHEELERPEMTFAIQTSQLSRTMQSIESEPLQLVHDFGHITISNELIRCLHTILDNVMQQRRNPTRIIIDRRLVRHSGFTDIDFDCGSVEVNIMGYPVTIKRNVIAQTSGHPNIMVI